MPSCVRAVLWQYAARVTVVPNVLISRILVRNRASAVWWLSGFSAVFPPWKSAYNSTLVDVGFVVFQLVLGDALLRMFGFPFPGTSHQCWTHSFIYHRRYISLAKERFVNQTVQKKRLGAVVVFCIRKIHVSVLVHRSSVLSGSLYSRSLSSS
jgi:hypothetical protein